MSEYYHFLQMPLVNLHDACKLLVSLFRWRFPSVFGLDSSHEHAPYERHLSCAFVRGNHLLLGLHIRARQGNDVFASVGYCNGCAVKMSRQHVFLYVPRQMCASSSSACTLITKMGISLPAFVVRRVKGGYRHALRPAPASCMCHWRVSRS